MLVNGKVAYLLIVWLWYQRGHVEARHPRLDEVAHAFQRRIPLNLDEATCARVSAYLRDEAARHLSSLRDHDDMPRAIRAICEDVARLVNSGHRCAIDKYNEYLLQLPDLDSIFPDARYVFIHRDPDDAAESMVRHFAGRPWAPTDHVAALEKWAHWNQLWVDYSPHIPSARRHEVCYENLVQEPARVIRDIFRFLGVDDGDNRVRDACRDIHSGRVGRGATSARALPAAATQRLQQSGGAVERVRAGLRALASRDSAL